MIAKLPVSILRDPAFARLWFIQASTQVGGNMALYALTILVFATTRSNTAVSALVMSFLIPAILLSAAAGVLVDRLDVRWAMIVPNTVRTLLTLGLALAGANVAVLLVLNLGVSLTSVVLTPSNCVTYIHYDAASLQIDHKYQIDLTQWHTLRFQRLNHVVTAFIDDMAQPVWTYRGSSATLPDSLKHVILQQECHAWACPAGQSGSEDIQIDWIVVDSPA